MSKRPLSDEEKNLWKKNIEGVKPLSSNQVTPALKPFPKLPESLPAITLDNLDIGRKTVSLTVDKISSREAKDIVIEGTLDLHGYTIESASRALEHFLIGRQQRGCRWVLVVTGKGEHGIIREFVPSWLDKHPQLVIGYTFATPKHGGEGALYVKVRKINGKG